VPANRGTPFLKEWERAKIEERLDVIYTPACMCGWRLEPMPLRDGKAAHEQHRAEQHPEMVVRKRRKRYRSWGQIQGGQPLDDNIAKARAQGAAVWAGE
jgi:hypothetical protein